MIQTRKVLALDIGTVRIGVAMADEHLRIPVPHGFLEVNGTEIEALKKLIAENEINKVVVGYPRNQSGEVTQQTELVEAVADRLRSEIEVVFQDESLTSVMAENRLKARSKAYEKGDIDAEAAVIILEDYLESH